MSIGDKAQQHFKANKFFNTVGQENLVTGEDL